MLMFPQTKMEQGFSHRMNILSRRYKDSRQVENKFLDVILAFLSTALKIQLTRQPNMTSGVINCFREALQQENNSMFHYPNTFVLTPLSSVVLSNLYLAEVDYSLL